MLRALGLGDMVAWQPAGTAQIRQVWRWFCHIDEFRLFPRLTEPATMPDGRMGWQVTLRATRIPPTEILAWEHLAGVELEPWQFAAILLIDDFFVRTRNDPPQPQVRASADGLKNMFKVLGMGRKKKK